MRGEASGARGTVRGGWRDAAGRLFRLLFFAPFVSCLGPAPGGATPVYTYEIAAAYPHDPTAFTQGLEYHDGALYEGTGRKGRSSVRRVTLETGEIEQIRELDDAYFGEGITILGDRIYQLTWRSRKGFIYDLASFELLGTFSYAGEGWGLTTDGVHLYMSDGTAKLRAIDPETFEVVREIEVREGDRRVQLLNELEWVNGEILANVYQTSYAVRIDPRSGQVTGWVQLADLLAPTERTANTDVLNGIAYDAEGDRLFVTGKNWPKVFEIRLEPTEETRSPVRR